MSEVYDKITEYVCHGGLYNPELMQHDKVRDLLIESRAEIARLKETNSQWISDSAETDTVVRGEARKVLAPMDVDGDSYAVPSIEDIVESLVSEIARLRGDAEVSRLRLEAAHAEIGHLQEAIRRLADQDATLSVCNGAVTVEMDGTLTPEEREVLQSLHDAHEESANLTGYVNAAVQNTSRKIASTLRGLLNRLGGDR